jgi:hypothetical protein
MQHVSCRLRLHNTLATAALTITSRWIRSFHFATLLVRRDFSLFVLASASYAVWATPRVRLAVARASSCKIQCILR